MQQLSEWCGMHGRGLWFGLYALVQGRLAATVMYIFAARNRRTRTLWTVSLWVCLLVVAATSIR